MTNQDQVIIACVLAAIALPLGSFYTFKAVNKFMRPIENRLISRHQDIELGDYIQHTNVRDIDLSSLPQYPQVIINNPFPVR
jgi:hypothetical protein